MNNLYFRRKENVSAPFTEEEINKLLSSDFELRDLRIDDKGFVTDIVVTSTKHPELTGLDPITKGIGLSLREEGGYWTDPRFFVDHDAYLNEVLPDLLTDLELEDDFEATF